MNMENEKENLEKKSSESNIEDNQENITEEKVEAEKIEVEETENNDEVLQLEKEINNLKEDNKKLNNESNSLKERLMRISSEYENFRKRTEKEKKAIYTNACEDILANMLPVLDNLVRAISVDGSAEDLKKGIEITIRQFEDAFKKLEVEEISTDCEFDPNYHNAIMHIEDENFEKNQIVEVFQKGFKRGDKVLRYSLVKVAN
ncbi:nucleotide exchange factor GrpE [Clostridium aestuarii]|uniref:Protein GrpE n=1 Tax=Clostridium aestuarii TaxID=338193 RepID=A0ABT4CZ52_9CLOT|nr:nucleotide exchange factor GrpE [Clostridium aestuarii]MCY6484259.1 nucleotide exchange factor GrpE [Clostridium aestuarii]